MTTCQKVKDNQKQNKTKKEEEEASSLSSGNDRNRETCLLVATVDRERESLKEYCDICWRLPQSGRLGAGQDHSEWGRQLRRFGACNKTIQPLLLVSHTQKNKREKKETNS